MFSPLRFNLESSAPSGLNVSGLPHYRWVACVSLRGAPWPLFFIINNPHPSVEDWSEPPTNIRLLLLPHAHQHCIPADCQFNVLRESDCTCSYWCCGVVHTSTAFCEIFDILAVPLHGGKFCKRI